MTDSKITTMTDEPKKKSKAPFITPILALVAAIGVGLIGGVVIGQNTASSTTAGARGSFSGGPGGTTDGTAPTGGGMGDFTAGSVVSVDGDTVVIESSDGTQVTVTTSTDTTVTTTEDSSVDQLAAGDTVTVRGETDDDGNVTATSISEGATGFGGGGGFPGGGTAPTTDAG